MIIVISAAVWFDRVRVSAPAVPTSPQSDISVYNQNFFFVVKVVDGDTIDIDHPDRGYRTTRIRLLGIDTPETAKSPSGEAYFGPQASEFTRKAALGKRVKVILDIRHHLRGRYGRLLAYVELPDREILNEKILSEGFAYADTRFPHEYLNRYLKLELAARKAKKGLWKNLTRDKAPPWVQRYRPELFEPRPAR